ncbi:hypothetical protein K449DRAFT_55976 [Hypoxylon sp. EC38]|nr:hypothetical protein K449DRAFT_55976 [Hypoxylon sp. EC38]
MRAGPDIVEVYIIYSPASARTSRLLLLSRILALVLLTPGGVGTGLSVWLLIPHSTSSVPIHTRTALLCLVGVQWRIYFTRDPWPSIMYPTAVLVVLTGTCYHSESERCLPGRCYHTIFRSPLTQIFAPSEQSQGIN